MSDKSCRVRVSRDGYEVEIEGDAKFVREMIAAFRVGPSGDALHDRPRSKSGAQAADEGSPPSKPGGTRGRSTGEFVRGLGLKKHTDLALAFAYYLDHERGVKDFTPADINNLYYEAKMENSNTSQVFVQNIRRGYMMSSKGDQKGGRQRYTLTHSGEKYIAERMKKAEQATQ